MSAPRRGDEVQAVLMKKPQWSGTVTKVTRTGQFTVRRHDTGEDVRFRRDWYAWDPNLHPLKVVSRESP